MKNITLLAFLMIVLISCKNDKQEEATPKTIGLLTISNEKPQSGETLDLIYKSDNVTDAFYYYMVGQNNYHVDIDFESLENEIKSSIKIPDSAEAVAFAFKVGDDYDTNDSQGYVIPLYNNKGEQIAGSDAAAAYFKVRHGSYHGISIKDAELTEVLKKDITANPNIKDEWESIYINATYQSDKAEGKKLIESHLISLSEKVNKSENDYKDMIKYYSTIGEKSKSDSIKSIVLEKYPNGTTANFEVVRSFYDESDLVKQEAIFANYLEKTSESDNWVNNMADNLARTYFEKGDMDKFEHYSSLITDKSNKASSLNNIAWSLAEKGENLDVAAKMSKTSLELITDLQNDPKDKPEYYTQRQFEDNLKGSFNMYADTYALILFKQGKVKEAITYQEKAQDPKAKDEEANARYISYLMADERYEAVVEKASEFIKLGYGNSETKAAYKKAFLKLNPSTQLKDVEDKIAELQKAGYNRSVEEIKSKMIDEEAPQFSLKDTNGKEVALADLKGKIVILDFWATWCGPCKSSFPGMQKVVTNYKDDDDVVLLFIDTFERGENKEQLVEDFIAKNKYTFHVVYDNEIKDSNDFEVAKKYDVEGIPTKVVIGQDGKMKFKSVGYGGSTDKLVEEMDIMIEILKS